MTGQLLTEARAFLPETIDLRRSLHRIPEVGLHLPETQAQVLEALSGLPLELRLHQHTSGIVGVLDGYGAGPAIILRGDMDGLPMREDTGLDFASTTGNTMHACGHDLHTAMLAGAANLLAGRADTFAGRVVFMFQPGEEGHHGARHMLEEGLLDMNPRPSAGFALHVTNMFASGTVNHRAGPLLASADEVRIRVTGRGGHASAPHLALDPIPVAAEIVLAVQTEVTRQFGVFDPVVVTFGKMAAGTTQNVIPEYADLMGTVRTLSDANRAAMHDMLQRVSTHVAAAHRMTAELEIKPGYPVTVNDATIDDLVARVAGTLVGSERVHHMSDPIMGAEDWSYVLREIPGAMAFLGARPPEVDAATAPMNHSNRVVFDEQCMAVGVALYAAIALEFLGGR